LVVGARSQIKMVEFFKFEFSFFILRLFILKVALI
jgi:hypothetical protein